MPDEDIVADKPELKNAPMPSRSVMAAALIGFVVVCVVALSVLGFAGRHGWLLDLCNHFRFQYLLVLGVTTVGLALLRSWRMGMVSLAGLVINAALVLPLYVSPGVQADVDGPSVTVMHFNVHTANTNHAGVIEQIHASGADLVFVQEINQRWLDALTAGLEGYTLVASEPRSDNFGIACFERQSANGSAGLVVTSSKVYDPTEGIAQVPVIAVEAEVAGRALSVLSIHPLPPISAEYARARNATLAAAGDWAAAQDVPCIVVGDLNATPWSTALRDLQSAGGLDNAQVGFSRSPSWPSGFNTLGMIPIDHLLHSRELVTTEHRIGDSVGSDHCPLVVTLRWRKADE